MSILAEQHSAHKERLARLNQRAPEAGSIKVKPKAVVIPIVNGRPFRPAPVPQPIVVPKPHVRDWLFVASNKPKRPTVQEIIAAVCLKYGLDREKLLSHRRTKDLVRPRQVAMYLANHFTDLTFPAIGREFAGRDHSTIMCAVQRIEFLCASDDQLRQEIEELRGQFNA